MYDLIALLLLLALGYVVGQYQERRHYRSIIQREKELSGIPAMAFKFLPGEDLQTAETVLVAGSVVISVDYFKRFVAGLRTLVGGRVTSYESLIDRARRESVLRMKEQARELGAQRIFNVKFETSAISKGRGNSIGSVEVLAYGTAVIQRRGGG
jgi:uncharacterized protein YbjQ (UPF0145 family)